MCQMDGILLSVVLVSVAVGIAAFRAMALGGYQRRWRALVPGWNLLVLGDAVGIDRRIFLAGAIVPLLFFLIFPWVGGAYARRSSQPLVLGVLLGLPPFLFLGYPILAILARQWQKAPSRDASADEPGFPTLLGSWIAAGLLAVVVAVGVGQLLDSPPLLTLILLAAAAVIINWLILWCWRRIPLR